MKNIKIISLSLVSSFLLSLAPSLALPQGGDDDKNYYSKRYDSLDVDTIFRSSRLLNNYVDCLLDKKPCPPEGKDLKRVLPHALRTKCARCTKIQKDKALDVITRLYYQYPSIYLALAERYDPKGEYTKNFENWFDEQQKEKLNGQLQNELPQRPRIPSTWITSTTSIPRTTTERSTSMRTLRTLPTVRTTTSGIIRIIPTTITERPSTVRTQPTTERITSPRSVPTTTSSNTTTFLTSTTPRTSIFTTTTTVKPSTIISTTIRPSTIVTTTTQRPTTSRSTTSLSTTRLTTLSTTVRPPTTQKLTSTSLIRTESTTFRPPSTTKITPFIRNDPPPFIPMKIPSSQMQFRPAMSSPSMFMTNVQSSTSARPIIQQQPFPAQSFQPPMQVNNGFVPSNTQNSPARFPTASVLQVQAFVANQNPFSVPLPIPREPSVPASTFRTPSVQRPPQQRPLERPLGPLPIDPNIIDNFFVPRNVQIQRSINQLLDRTNSMVSNMMRSIFGG